MLVADNVYRPTRNFCNTVLARLGIPTTYFDSLIGDITALMRPNTRAVFLEAPGSQSFEMPDVPAIAAAAHAAGAVVLMDNTWATPLYFRPFEKGVDLSIQAGTKYIVGHSDVMFGTVSANAATWPHAPADGPHDGPMRRAGRHVLGASAACAPWGCGSRAITRPGCTSRAGSRTRPEVLRVLHPALETDPGHAIWRRDFTGASGLFSIVLKPVPQRGGQCLSRCAHAVRHGILVGRLREPGDLVRLRRVSHGDQVGARRPDAALPYRAGRRRPI